MKAPGYSVSLNKLLAAQGIPPRYIANFDSATAMLKALANYLQGQEFPGSGMVPPVPLLGDKINTLPRKAREMIYSAGGWAEAIAPNKLGKVRSEALTGWAVSNYPQRRYPAVMVGSSSGALVHLGAALGVPWLPQTFLVPIRQTDVHPDEPRDAMEKAQGPAQMLLEANPDLQLHHMHDPNQDRLMLHLMNYFRVKLLRLGPAYEEFIRTALAPGGTIFVVECQATWPTTRLGDRHIFQMGAVGGATPEEFLSGSERVAEYLRTYDSHVERWDAPEPNGETPEAEWGFEPALRGDIEQFARRHGYRVQRIVFEQPDHLSPLVAELYRWWYRQRGIRANRMLVESFVILEPHWTLRTGSAPFWLKFNMEPSLHYINEYLDSADPYDEIYMTLFSHGVSAVGLPSIEEWRQVLSRARTYGSFIGIDEQKFPRHFASFTRYHHEIQQRIMARYPLPGMLALSQFETFLREQGHRFAVQWLDHEVLHERAVGA